MLVIKRSKDQSFKLMTSDGEVTIKVTAYHGNAVSLGIAAPESVRIIRDDIKNKTPHKLKVFNRPSPPQK